MHDLLASRAELSLISKVAAMNSLVIHMHQCFHARRHTTPPKLPCKPRHEMCPAFPGAIRVLKTRRQDLTASAWSQRSDAKSKDKKWVPREHLASFCHMAQVPNMVVGAKVQVRLGSAVYTFPFALPEHPCTTKSFPIEHGVGFACI